MPVVAHEEGDPQGAGQALYGWLQQNEERGIAAEPPPQPIVVDGHAYGEPPCRKGDAAEQHGERIADEAGAEVETGLQFEPLAAYGAGIGHSLRS